MALYSNWICFRNFRSLLLLRVRKRFNGPGFIEMKNRIKLIG